MIWSSLELAKIVQYILHVPGNPVEGATAMSHIKFCSDFMRSFQVSLFELVKSRLRLDIVPN